jgi:TonB family protein
MNTATHDLPGSPDFSAALAFNPIGAAYRPAPRLASLGASILAWSLIGTGGYLVYRLQAVRPMFQTTVTQAMSLMLNETDTPVLEGGGHQGGGLPPAPTAAPAFKAATPPPPPPASELQDREPLPVALPTQPLAAPPLPSSYGVAGGTGTGTGPGTGSGSGIGLGSGSGAGNGASAGVQSPDAAPLVVPYSQISVLKLINPDYPDRARRVGLQGDVVVRVTIDETGRPTDLHVVGGEPMLVKETLKVLPQWRFSPVFHLGRKVRATFDAVLRFNLA